MTYLQICQLVNTLVGMQGTLSSASSATGYQATIAQLVANAWVDIQNLRKEWDFLKTSVTFNTVTSQTEYTITNIFGSATSPVGRWYLGYYNKAADDKVPLSVVSYEYYLTSSIAQDTAKEPYLFAIDPTDKHLYLSPPDGVYSLTFHYFRKPIVLSADSDVPAAPAEFHYAIAYRAAADYANFLGNSDLYFLYLQKANSVIGSTLRSEIPSRRIKVIGAV